MFLTKTQPKRNQNAQRFVASVLWQERNIKPVDQNATKTQNGLWRQFFGENVTSPNTKPVQSVLGRAVTFNVTEVWLAVTVFFVAQVWVPQPLNGQSPMGRARGRERAAGSEAGMQVGGWAGTHASR